MKICIGNVSEVSENNSEKALICSSTRYPDIYTILNSLLHTQFSNSANNEAVIIFLS